MSRQIVVGDLADQMVGDFMRLKLHQPNGFQAGRAIGMVHVPPQGPEFAQMIAGVWFENYNGANMMMHVAAEPNSSWMTKELLWYVFHYVFVECGCKRVTGLVSASNDNARQFDERIGFELEAVLKDAAPDGDILVYRMFRDDCKWLKLAGRFRRVH